MNGGVTTTGYIAALADDFLMSGSEKSQKWKQAVECFRKAHVWSPWENTPYTHCGVGVVQTHSYCEEIKQIDIDASEGSQDETSQARAVVGSIQRRALQTAPQHMAKLS